MSAQCHEDINACIVGFLNLCNIYLLKKDCTIFITPALINSDVVENTFNQMRSTYNGANTTIWENFEKYCFWQKIVSVKANAGKNRDGAILYDCNLVKRAVKRKQEGQVALKCSPEFCLKLTYRYL